MKRLTLISLASLVAVLLSACATSGGRGASWPGLAADTTNAYLADGQYVYAVRLSDGTKIWQYPEKAGASIFYSTPVLTADGQVLVGSAANDHALYAIDPNNVDPATKVPVTKWIFNGAADHFIAPPLVVGDMVYAPNNDGTLYALKLATGEKLWALPISHSLWSTPVSNGKLLFLASLDHFLYAIDPQAQKIVWKTDLGGAVPGSPALSADGATLYVGSFASKVLALNAEDGRVRWTADTKSWVWATPVVDGDTVYVTDIDGSIYSLGAPNGKNAWPDIQPDESITGSPLILSDGVLVATESGTVFAFDRNGGKAWDVNVGGKIYTTPIASGNFILLSPLNADFLLAAVDQKGTLVWKFTGK
jgi:outer membrane protein assembly factor BamB